MWENASSQATKNTGILSSTIILWIRQGDNTLLYKNLSNEWYCKDMSRKLKSTLYLKSKQGYAVGHLTYGYKYGEDKKGWIVNDEASEVVKRIFSMRLQKVKV